MLLARAVATLLPTRVETERDHLGCRAGVGILYGGVPQEVKWEPTHPSPFLLQLWFSCRAHSGVQCCLCSRQGPGPAHSRDDEVGFALELAIGASCSLKLRRESIDSHSAPYQCDSPDVAVSLVKAWVGDANLDILSPQLYSSGMEGAPQFDTTASCSPSCSWSLYQGFKGGES